MTQRTSNSQHPIPASSVGGRGHIVALDGFRGLAVILVMVHHASSVGRIELNLRGSITALLDSAWIGVDFFFVLSGFLITGILLDTLGSRRYLLNFYARRTLRIFPLYYGTLLVLYVLLPAMPGLHATAGDSSLWLWFYCSNILLTIKHTWWMACTDPFRLPVTHFWSLAVEEHFYLLWPACVLLLSRARLKILCLAVVCLLPFIRFAWLLHTHGSGYVALYVLTPFRIDGLCLGGLLAILARERGGLAPWLMTARFVLGGAASYQLLRLAIRHTLGRESWDFASFGYSAVALAAGAILVLAIVGDGKTALAKALDSKFLRFFGKYSYGLYVFHGLLLPVFDKIFPPKILSQYLHSAWLALAAHMLLSIAMAACCAMLSWHLYEKHWLKLKTLFRDTPARSISTRPDPLLNMTAGQVL